MTTIGTNLFYDRAAGRLASLSGATTRLQTQISTGIRLEAPSDDAVAFARLQTLARDGADATVNKKNLDLAKTVLGQADTTLGDVTSQLQRAQELVIQANSGTLTDANRAIIATQLRGIVDDLVGLANTRDARGEPLFGAATGDTAVTRNASGTVSFTGTGTPAAIPIGDGLNVQPSESAERIFGGIGGSDIFATLSNFVTALETPGAAATSAAASGTIAGLATALDQTSAARGSIGARAARLDLESARIETTDTARETERGGLQDTDITKAIIDLQKASTILQATQSSLSRLSQLSLFDYLR
ncbi:MAG: flagellar hook-associated protein FlgL [Sphingomonas sp.]|uniref:flagellar hook-associated protein FlgL n=1 Tax=Sphingomonas sp. TaxID=28214 RepID=UPI0025D6159B|nr:flagellar hook-associated protein FlgL [Sphingomonas sp.]MBY0282548.1 flagellar hook-associated protein FlgL [Sphingomonas sp.]